MEGTDEDSDLKVPSQLTLISGDGIKIRINCAAVESDDVMSGLTALLILHFSPVDASAKVSDFVRTFCEDFEENSEIPVVKVKSETLIQVVEFLNKYEQEPMKEIATPLPHHTIEGVVEQQWYRDYVCRMDYNESYQLYLAADYMNISE